MLSKFCYLLPLGLVCWLARRYGEQFQIHSMVWSHATVDVLVLYSVPEHVMKDKP